MEIQNKELRTKSGCANSGWHRSLIILVNRTIQQLHHGKNGLIPVAIVQTAKGEIKRPIVKLIPLPTDDKLKIETSQHSTK